MIDNVILAAQERVQSLDDGLLETMEESRPDRVWEKAHTYPMSQQDLFSHVDCDPTDWEHAQEIDSAARVYVHIPWCEERCTFCRYSVDTRDASDERVNPYLESLEKELSQKAALLGVDKIFVEHLYIGGGTPSSLESHQIDSLFEVLGEYLIFTESPFLITECSPGTITLEKAHAFKRNGIGRMSMGVQSFDDNVLEIIRRDHSAAQAKEAYGILREVGFDEVNLDIMLALPGQGYETFQNTMNEAISLGPSSLSLLDLHVAPKSALLAQGFEHNFQTNLVMRAMYQLMMRETDYIATRPHYYVLPNEAPHPATRCPMLDSRVDVGLQLGFGVSAVSHVGDSITINSLGGKEYSRRVGAGESAVTRAYTLTEQDKISMRALRTLNETSFLPEREEVLGYFSDEISFMQKQGLMNENLHLTEEGRLFGSEVCFMLYPR